MSISEKVNAQSIYFLGLVMQTKDHSRKNEKKKDEKNFRLPKKKMATLSK